MTPSSRGLEGEPPPVQAPHTIRWPVNVHDWSDISFLHWPVPPEDIEALLPQGLRPLTWEGRAWVGVTPFFIRVRPLWLPVVPPRWAFPETNVRTYVAGPDGREGIWFLHNEVTALWFVAALRVIGLPYVRQAMTVDVDDGVATYRSRPRRPGGSGGHDVVVRHHEQLQPPHGGPGDLFLTARWGAFHQVGLQLLYTPVDHGPWPLRRAEAERCEVRDLFVAAGLSAPAGPPVVHFSPGVTVRVGRPSLVS